MLSFIPLQFTFSVFLFVHSGVSTRFSPRENLPQRPQPSATVKNGTLGGFYLPEFEQDVFYGIPFAAPPVGPRRLNRPEVYDEKWVGVKDATVRSKSCPGGGPFAGGLDMGEDCLTLDIVRPSLSETTKTSHEEGLPVLAWIYGGGFQGGGTADPRYNTSYLVQNSVEIEKPTIVVSINYRLAGFGFLASKEVLDAGIGNLGLFDQRLALRWLKENIGAFGGDPSKITIWGESAGAYSVAHHIIGFDGEHDDLFRGAILESGTSLAVEVISPSQLESSYQPWYDNATQATGCSDAEDTLECLRNVPYEDLYDAISIQNYFPIVDGEFLARLPSESYAKGLVADVAILAGANTDEGTAYFLGPRGTLNTDSDIRDYLVNLRAGFNDDTVETIMDLYPDDPSLGCPFGTGEERFADQGYQYKRGAAIAGDISMHAGRRATVNYHSKHSQQPVYSYRFDQPPWNGVDLLIAPAPPLFASHYIEIPFVFDNPNNNTNWIGPYPSFKHLADIMSRSWISFTHDLDPNGHQIADVPYWPDYREVKGNMVFNANETWVEKDDWREDQLEFWSTIWEQLNT
ncbi:hypothetical protein FQN54_004789 [Arachnomyces sp. PD_36]|nr:hypothetical protein FQN54_004789 [Arachnomyces sp. PD_36]